MAASLAVVLFGLMINLCVLLATHICRVRRHLSAFLSLLWKVQWLSFHHCDNNACQEGVRGGEDLPWLMVSVHHVRVANGGAAQSIGTRTHQRLVVMVD